jgi:nucleotide-binding universal stress UspA family protein
MYARILVPLDGSPESEQVLHHAQRLAQTFDASVVLVSAVEKQPDVPDSLVKDLQREREAYLQGIVTSLPAELKARSIVETGRRAEVVILEHAEARGATLIVMGTRGFSGLKRLMLGSVAHKVVQAAMTPVLLIPPNAKSPEGGPVELERMIVPLDGSTLAEHILPYAVAAAKALGMELIVLRAYNPRFPGSTIRMHEVSQIVRDSAENYLKEKVSQLQAEGLAKVSYKIVRGVPSEQITEFAIETPNSVTAMCTHGRHGVGKWLLGSVTHAVIHCLEEPVLVVRAPQDA